MPDAPHMCTPLPGTHPRSTSALQGTQFSVMVTEGRPDNTGITMAKALTEMGVPVTLVLDSGVAYAMGRVDMVLIGAEGVVENGGVINKLGSYQVGAGGPG
jgi:translation initiation factor eIF-2B subunit alpha